MVAPRFMHRRARGGRARISTAAGGCGRVRVATAAGRLPTASVDFAHEPSPGKRGLVVVLQPSRSPWELDLVALDDLVRDSLQDVRDHVQPCAFLVVGADDVPGSVLGVRRLQHHVPRPRVLVPAGERSKVHGTELPLAQRILDARFEPSLLLFLTYLQPDLDEPETGMDDVALEDRAVLEEIPVLLFRAEAHHILDAGAVVPGAIEDDDLAGRGKVLEIALDVQLGLLPVGGNGKRRQAEDPWADALGERLEVAPLARRVTSLDDDDHPRPCLDYVLLKDAELSLEPPQLLLVLSGLQFRGGFDWFSRVHKSPPGACADSLSGRLAPGSRPGT